MRAHIAQIEGILGEIEASAERIVEHVRSTIPPPP
jgi:hypothetical protein